MSATALRNTSSEKLNNMRNVTARLQWMGTHLFFRSWVGQVECTQKKEHVVNLQLDIDMKNIDALSLNSSYTV